MASGMSITVVGLEKARARLEKLDAKRLAVVTRRGFSLAGSRLASAMRAEAPFRTGNLRNSIRSRGRRGTWYVGPTARYRHLVIRGTKDRRPGSNGGGGVMPSNPFVDRVLARHTPGVIRNITDGIIRATR